MNEGAAWKRRVTPIRPALHLAAYTPRNDLRGLHMYACVRAYVRVCVCTGFTAPVAVTQALFPTFEFIGLSWREGGGYR